MLLLYYAMKEVVLKWEEKAGMKKRRNLLLGFTPKNEKNSTPPMEKHRRNRLSLNLLILLCNF